MLLTKNDFLIGQEVACKHAGNKARYNQGVTLGTICKVGRKLITVAFDKEEKHTVKFELEETFERDYLLQKTNMAGDYEMFPSLKAYEEYEEKLKKLGRIQTAVALRYSNSALTIDQVRRIYDIINE